MRKPLFLLLLLASCADPEPEGAAASSEPIECALAGAAGFDRACSLERTRQSDGLVLTVSGPDGSFRRLLVTGDERLIVAADGALPARVTERTESHLEVTVASDRYRIPAGVASGPLQGP
jgi:hypothetical protein